MDFETVFSNYYKDVFKFTLSLSGNYEIAEEITQESFFKALKSLQHFDGKKDIRAWLFTIARNTYYTYIKKDSKNIILDEASITFDDTVNVEEKLIDENTVYQIHCFLHSMKEPYKEVFSLRTFGELPFDKIGRLFGKSSSWARVTYYRAKLQIKEYMEELENE